MTKQVILISKIPNGIFPKQLEAYLLKHFPEISVQKEDWKGIESVGSDNLVIAQYFPGCSRVPGSSPPIQEYEFKKRVKEIPKKNIVFILQPWERYSQSDIPKGLAGVIHKPNGKDFEGFTRYEKVQPAHQLLEKYLK